MARFYDRVASRLEREASLAVKRSLQMLRHAPTRRPERQTLFVSGVQRSGTEMIMSTLERSLETDVFHESDPRAFEDYQMRPPEVIHGLIDRSPASRVVIKSLCEGQYLRRLLDEFAPAKALWVFRRYGDMVNSHLRKWSGCARTVEGIVGDRNSAGWRARDMSDATHAVVKARYHPDMADPSAVALFWYFRNVLFFEQDLEEDDRVLLVRYESLVSDPERQFRTIFDFAGLNFSSRLVRKVHNRSVGKHPEPEIEPAVRELCESLTARFEARLAR